MPVAGIHLLLSLLVAGAVAVLVFCIWFPWPLRELAGGESLFWLVIGVDVVSGPMLTLVLFNPKKPRSELRIDLSLVVIIQLLALAYGVHTLAHARPVALVHEVDRFRVVTYSDLNEVEADLAPSWAQPWSLERPRTMGVRPVSTSDEKLDSINASLQGVEPSQRPKWWQDYALSAPLVLQRAQPLVRLRHKHPSKAELIDAAIERAMADGNQGEATDGAALLWLPLVSRRAMDWVVLLDPVTARIRGYAHIEGF